MLNTIITTLRSTPAGKWKTCPKGNSFSKILRISLPSFLSVIAIINLYSLFYSVLRLIRPSARPLPSNTLCPAIITTNCSLRRTAALYKISRTVSTARNTLLVRSIGLNRTPLIIIVFFLPLLRTLLLIRAVIL